MPKSFFKNEINVNESLLDKGLKIIIQAFNEQKNEFSQRLSLLQSENKKLKEENFLYKNKLTSLQQKLNSLSKTALLLDEETEDKKIEEKKIMEHFPFVFLSFNRIFSYAEDRLHLNNKNK